MCKRYDQETLIIVYVLFYQWKELKCGIIVIIISISVFRIKIYSEKKQSPRLICNNSYVWENINVTKYIPITSNRISLAVVLGVTACSSYILFLIKAGFED